MNSIEEYQNLVELLKIALEFYADKNNYHNAMGNPAMIDFDEHGSQARFALSKIKELEKINQEIENDYNKYIDKYVDDVENNLNFNNIINSMKSVENGENNNI
jgi:type III secretory pathway component EscR